VSKLMDADPHYNERRDSAKTRRGPSEGMMQTIVVEAGR
jgi:hypothetical protein